MLTTEVVAHIVAAHMLIGRIVADGCIMELVAVVMVHHECPHVCVIVGQVYRCGMPVVVREVIPVPG